MHWFKILVLLLALGIGFGVMTAVAPEAVLGVESALLSTDQPQSISGAWRTFVMFLQVIVYSLIFVLVAGGILAVVTTLRIGVGLLDWIGGACKATLATVRSWWEESEPPLDVETAVVVGGRRVALRQVLGGYARKVIAMEGDRPVTLIDELKSMNERMSYLERLTSQLDPLPEPKTPEELADEMAAELEAERARARKAEEELKTALALVAAATAAKSKAEVPNA